MAARFVAPATVEAAEFQSRVLMNGEMEIFDRRKKRRGAVVVAFDGKYMPAERHFSHALDKIIRNVAAANQHLRPQFAVEIDLFFIGDNERSHENTSMLRADFLRLTVQNDE